MGFRRKCGRNLRRRLLAYGVCAILDIAAALYDTLKWHGRIEEEAVINHLRVIGAK